METISVVQTCPVCEGTGKQYNPDWSDYLQACMHSELGGYVSNVVKQTDFFHSRGYAVIPNIIEPCSCCDGGGHVVVKISLKDYYELPNKTASELGFVWPASVSSGRL